MENKRKNNNYRNICLGPIITNKKDFYVIDYLNDIPNFITCKKIKGSIMLIGVKTKITNEIEGKIIVAENADPGYDWIFACNIKALITKHGGPNSHMAIRCNEFGIPAVIGCGNRIYSDILKHRIMEIDCLKRTIKSF
jgi:phosphoenolpyruvate-protein kinase (PTS system EI component)